MIKKSSMMAAWSGFVGGLIGIGGNGILIPFWLGMKLPNNRVYPTATLSLVFTTFSALFTNFLADSYNY